MHVSARALPCARGCLRNDSRFDIIELLMALSQFSDPPLSTMVSSLSSGSSLTLVIGAGASVEARLPTWSGLLRDLLARAATERFAMTDAGLQKTWIDQIMHG